MQTLLTETTSETTSETSSSSSEPENLNQEEEGIQKIEKELISLFEDLGVFENLWQDVVNSGWDPEELIELGSRIKKGAFDNPGAIFVWRVKHHKPPRHVYTHKVPADAPEPIQDDIEQIPDQVISAWEKTCDQVKQEIKFVDYLTWFEPIQIRNYNGALILKVCNRLSIEKLKDYKLTEETLSSYFSGYLGQDVPVQFVVG